MSHAHKNEISTMMDLSPLEQISDDYDISLLEERFCQMVALRGVSNLVECYRSAFPSSSGYTEHQILGHCNTLLSKKEIEKRVKELRSQNLDASKVVKSFKISVLKRVIEEALEFTNDKGVKDHRSVISAIAELNKMQGDYTPPRAINVNSGGVSQEEEKEIRQVIDQYEKDY